VLEVIDKIHAEPGDDKTITVRLGFYDAIPYPYGWGVDKDDYRKPDLTEPKRLLKLMVDRGVRMINFTISNPVGRLIKRSRELTKPQSTRFAALKGFCRLPAKYRRSFRKLLSLVPVIPG